MRIPFTPARAAALAFVGAASLLATIPVSAQITIGQTIVLDFQSVTPGLYVDMDAGGTSYTGNAAGVYNFATSGNANFAPTLNTFCIEISQFIDYSPHTFTVVSLAEGSKNSNNDNIPASGLGADRARNLQILYYTAFGSSFEATDFADYFVASGSVTANEKRAAFQIAVWELAHDDAGAGNAFSLSGGGFTLSSPVSGDVVNWANDLLSDVTSILNSGSSTIAASQIPLLALHNNDGTTKWQDQIIAIPEPGTWAALLGVLSLAAVAVRRRVLQRPR